MVFNRYPEPISCTPANADLVRSQHALYRVTSLHGQLSHTTKASSWLVPSLQHSSMTPSWFGQQFPSMPRAWQAGCLSHCALQHASITPCAFGQQSPGLSPHCECAAQLFGSSATLGKVVFWWSLPAQHESMTPAW